MNPSAILTSLFFRLFLAAAIIGACGYAGWRLKAHFAAIEHAQDVAAVATANQKTADEHATCLGQIADANNKAAKDLADANARLATAVDALAREQGRASTLRDKLEKALSDESHASKLSTAVLNYLSLLRGSYTGGEIDAESAVNFGPPSGSPRKSP